MTRLLFDITFLAVAPFWVLMILAPRWRWTATIIASPLICVPPLLIYAVQVLPEIGAFLPVLADPNLPALQGMLAGEVGAAVAWAHFIAFDLFLGRWIHLDSRARGIHPAVISVLLVFTILFAPLGVLGYLVIRALTEPRSLPGRNIRRAPRFPLLAPTVDPGQRVRAGSARPTPHCRIFVRRSPKAM